LHLAAAAGHEATVEMLLDKGASIEAKDDYKYEHKYGGPPLLVAAEWGQNAIVRLLLEKGANIEAEDDNGLRALHWAVRGKKLDWNPTAGVHADMVRLLLEMGADFEAKDKRGRRPLWYAVDAGDEEVMKLLLEKGATPLS
ncbi:ankyrin, partial [Canariomyces notabilis]